MQLKHQWYVISLLFILSTVSCVPKPGAEQIDVKDGVIGNLVVEGSTNLGVNPVNETRSFFLTLRNTGQLEINMEELTLTKPEIVKFMGDKYPGFGGNCKTKLKSNESCRLGFQAFGNKVLSFSESFEIKHTNGLGPTVYQGTFTGHFGEAANLKVLGRINYDFGIVEPGVTKYATLEIENTGDLPAENVIGAFDTNALEGPIFHFDNQNYPGPGGNCPRRIEGKVRCTIVVAVTPQIAGKTTNANIRLIYQNPATTQTMSFPLRVYAAELKAYLTVVEQYQNAGNVLNRALAADVKKFTWTLKNEGLAAGKEILMEIPEGTPFVFDSTTCPVDGVAPREQCTITYKLDPQYPVPLPAGMSFPINLGDKIVTFSYNDGKYPTRAITNEVIFTGKILDEAHLVFYRDGSTATPFTPNNPAMDSQTSTWARSNFEGIVGADSYPERDLSISNIGVGTRFPATEITFQVLKPDGTASDGYVKVACMTSGTCPNQM